MAKEKVFIGQSDRLPMMHCPNCNRLIDAATPVSQTNQSPKPKPGSMTVCMYCAVWLIFEESIASATPLRLRLATKAEIETLYRGNPFAPKMEQMAREIAGRPQRG